MHSSGRTEKERLEKSCTIATWSTRAPRKKKHAFPRASARSSGGRSFALHHARAPVRSVWRCAVSTSLFTLRGRLQLLALPIAVPRFKRGTAIGSASRCIGGGIKPALGRKPAPAGPARVCTYRTVAVVCSKEQGGGVLPYCTRQEQPPGACQHQETCRRIGRRKIFVRHVPRKGDKKYPFFQQYVVTTCSVLLLEMKIT